MATLCLAASFADSIPIPHSRLSMSKRLKCGIFAMLFLTLARPVVAADPLTFKCIPSVNCDSAYHPVCGSDGTTYLNKCWAEAQKRDCDPHLTYVPKACEESSCKATFNPACSLRRAVVCGSDGVTYFNECFADTHRAACHRGLKYVPGHCSSFYRPPHSSTTSTQPPHYTTTTSFITRPITTSTTTPSVTTTTAMSTTTTSSTDEIAYFVLPSWGRYDDNNICFTELGFSEIGWTNGPFPFIGFVTNVVDFPIRLGPVSCGRPVDPMFNVIGRVTVSLFSGGGGDDPRRVEVDYALQAKYVASGKTEVA
eukprot:Selendium_serpulae@DN6407_c0_g1_i4.p1